MRCEVLYSTVSYIVDIFDPWFLRSTQELLIYNIWVCKYIMCIRGKKVFPHLFFIIDVRMCYSIAAIVRWGKYSI